MVFDISGQISLIPRPSFGVTAGWSLSFVQIFLSLSIYLCFVKAWVYNQLSKFCQILRPRAQLYSKSLQIIKQQLVPQLWPCQWQIFLDTLLNVCGGHVWGTFSLQDYFLQPASRIFCAKCRDIRQDSNKKLDSTLHRTVFFACVSHKRINVNLKKHLSSQWLWPLWWYPILDSSHRNTSYTSWQIFWSAIYICTCMQCMS